jgi:hypothetical protein
MTFVKPGWLRAAVIDVVTVPHHEHAARQTATAPSATLFKFAE